MQRLIVGTQARRPTRWSLERSLRLAPECATPVATTVSSSEIHRLPANWTDTGAARCPTAQVRCTTQTFCGILHPLQNLFCFFSPPLNKISIVILNPTDCTICSWHKKVPMAHFISHLVSKNERKTSYWMNVQQRISILPERWWHLQSNIKKKNTARIEYI